MTLGSQDPENPVPQSYINDNGNRIVIETNYMPSAERCQLIFERSVFNDGKKGWKVSLCCPGTPPFRLTDEQATQLAYGLRNALTST